MKEITTKHGENNLVMLILMYPDAHLFTKYMVFIYKPSRKLPSKILKLEPKSRPLAKSNKKQCDNYVCFCAVTFLQEGKDLLFKLYISYPVKFFKN